MMIERTNVAVQLRHSLVGAFGVDHSPRTSFRHSSPVYSVDMAETPSVRGDIDPMLKSILDALPFRFTAEDGVEVPRQLMRQTAPAAEMLPEMRIEELKISHFDRADLPVRIYWPPITDHEILPIVVFYHGGGFALGDLDTHEVVARSHATGAQAIVVSVDYRLAPENPSPAAFDDAWAALQWVGVHAAELGGDPARIAVAGDSAGGNLSAVVAQLARDNGGPAVVFQLLWYPSTGADLSLPSFTENADGPILTREVIETFLRWYLPEIDLGAPGELPPTFAPANASDLSNLPPAYIGVAQHDPLRDDGKRYADLLRKAGVAVEFHNEPHMTHGFVQFALAAPAAAEATNRGVAALKAALWP
jgi:acetyl esterase